MCDAEAIAQRAVALRERMAANSAEGRPLYAKRSLHRGDARHE